ncbi:hypothetical protein Tco_0266787 [Tanacetum coccineum]
MGDENPIRTLGNYSRLDTRAIETPLSSPMGTIWCLCDPTPSVQIFYDHVNPATRRTIDQAAGGKLRDKNTAESLALLEDLALYDNESWNDPRDFSKPVKAISLPQDVVMVPTTLNIAWKIPSKLLLTTRPGAPTKWEISGSLQTKDQETLTKPPTFGRINQTLIGHELKPSQEGRLFSLGSQLKHQQDDVISKISALWKAVSKKFDNASTHDTTRNSMANMNFVSTEHPKEGAPQSKGIKSPSKLLSLKYLSQSSLEEQNRNPSSLKRVYYINSIVILRKEDEPKEEDTVKPDAAEDNDHNAIVKTKKNKWRR